jgi:CNT family concentrative nucleoside transporter
MFGIENAQSLVGIGLTFALCWAMSHDRRRFPWRLAPGALTMQVALVLLLCGFPPAQGVL